MTNSFEKTAHGDEMARMRMKSEVWNRAIWGGAGGLRTSIQAKCRSSSDENQNASASDRACRYLRTIRNLRLFWPDWKNNPQIRVIAQYSIDLVTRGSTISFFLVSVF